MEKARGKARGEVQPPQPQRAENHRREQHPRGKQISAENAPNPNESGSNAENRPKPEREESTPENRPKPEWRTHLHRETPNNLKTPM